MSLACADGHTHLVVTVHGWMGNDRELSYLEKAIEREKGDLKLEIYAAKANVGRTSDGIQLGGQRLAEEIMTQINEIRSKDQLVSLSIVGNSLGGLYARYALAELDWTDVKPLLFISTATPHIGVSKNTYLTIPSFAEYIIGNALFETGRDLFLLTPLIEQMSTTEKFLKPLGDFKKRIAVANAFNTDFQVPTTTAAFLSKSSSCQHLTAQSSENSHYLLEVETTRQDNLSEDKSKDMTYSLDALGWTKIFLDLRDVIPFPSIPLFFNRDIVLPERSIWTSQELFLEMNRFGSKWTVPMGHTVSIANSKSDSYSEFNANGRPIMDQLARDTVQLMRHLSNTELPGTIDGDE